MKKFLLTISLMTIISIPTFANIIPPYFGIFPNVQGFSYMPKSGNIKGGTDLGAGYGMEFMIGRELFFYCRGAAFLYTEKIFDYPAGRPSDIFFGVGAGYRVLDLREDGKGHLITTSLTFSTTIPFTEHTENNDFFKREMTATFLGAEAFATYYYNFYKHFALRFGANFGVFYSKFDDKYTIHSLQKTTTTHSDGVTITYGLSIGLAF